MSLRQLVARMLTSPRSWMHALLQRERLENEMEIELAGHLDNLTADLIRAGHSPHEAARRARIALGPALVHKEEMRASLGLRGWDELRADLRYGMRMLRKSPSFTFIAAASLALAIGANTTIFAVGKRLLFDRLPVSHPEQLRLLRWNGDGKEVVHNMWGDFDSMPHAGTTSSVFSYPAYLQLRDHNQSLGTLFAFKEDSMNATLGGNAQRVTVAMVSGNFYTALGVHPQLGREIQTADDGVPRSGSVAIISDAVWQLDYGRSPSVLGQTITLNQSLVTIVGVNPRGFTGAKNVLQSPDIFVPLSMQPVLDPKGKTASALSNPDFWWVNVMARTRAGVKDAVAQAALDVQLQSAIRETMMVRPGDTVPRLVLADGSRGLHWADRMFQKPMYVLLALTGFVVLLACANIANLLLARGTQRQREMSVRMAMGAARSRILRQLLTESLLLAALGGLGGLVLGFLTRNAIPGLLTPSWEPNDINASFDWGVFGFTAAVTLMTGILFGLAPALLAARAEVGSTLKETAKSATRRRRGLGGKSIVAFQIALSTLLVVGAGLFARTLIALNAVDVGFNANHLLLFEIQPPSSRYPAGKDIRLHAQLQQKIAGLPGVESIATAVSPYIADNMNNSDFLPEGESFEDYKNRDDAEAEDINIVSNGFFQTMSIPIVAGRSFGTQDTSSSQKVAIINRSLARKRFPNVNPIGKRFRADRDEKSGWIEIVGICADTRYMNLREDPPPQFFLPYLQQPDISGMVYQVRTQTDAAVLTPELRRIVRSVDPDLPVIDVRTQREQMNASMQVERAFAALTAGFGVLALTLACVGIYGIMAYSVSQRTNEIGIRLALGARPAQLRTLILRESAWLSLSGTVVGVAAALMLTRMVKSMLYGIQPYDPPTLIVGVAILLAVALAASWIPARRAAAVEPMVALRHE
jgi:predicted permease